LANDRLYIKPIHSSVVDQADIPKLAYLPPLAGVLPKEERLSGAAQKRLVGSGVAGAVVRNMLLDLWVHQTSGLKSLRRPTGAIPSKAKAEFLKSDGWQALSGVLVDVFKCGLQIGDYDDNYHNRIYVHVFNAYRDKATIKKSAESITRDIVVEGSGFLQWLSVYALAVNDTINILLLDEPDSHLHPDLQSELVFRLNLLAIQQKKQVFLTTHSTTILSSVAAGNIFRIEQNKYLATDTDISALFAGLGSEFSPRLDRLKRAKRLFFHEGPSDLELLKTWAKTLKITWPDNLVAWQTTESDADRQTLFRSLKAEISGLKCLSLRDRDLIHANEIDENLGMKSQKPKDVNFISRIWKRTNIEGYLMSTPAIARAIGQTPDQVEDYIKQAFSVFIPDDYVKHDIPAGLLTSNGKDIIVDLPNSITNFFQTSYTTIAEQMTPDEICDDVKVIINQIVTMCRLS